MARYDDWDDQTVLAEVGERIRDLRLNRNVSQEELSERSGVSTRTISQIESGGNTSLETLIKLMRALGVLDRLDVMFPDEGPSPIQLLELQGRRRRRATGTRGS